MKLVLTHDTALQLLRAERELCHERIEPSRIRTLDDCASSLEEIESFALPPRTDNAKTLHVLVSSQASKCRSRTHVCHTMSLEIPRSSFCKVGDRVYAPTPELLFVQMANGNLSFVDLVLLGLELCGTYTLRSNGEQGFYNCPAISSREKIASYLSHAGHLRGAANARRALRWVRNGSNSPMESALMLFFCLPVRMGGYGLPVPCLNPETPLGSRAFRMLHQDTIRCDLHWQQERVVVEYDSSQEHLNPNTAARDSQRRNTLGYKGVDVITVTPKMIAIPAEFDSVVKQLARALGKRMRPDALVLSQARSELRFQLFPWLKSRQDAQFF